MENELNTVSATHKKKDMASDIKLYGIKMLLHSKRHADLK